MTTRLSSLQFPLMEKLLSRSYTTYTQAQAFDQRPFRSLLIREWIAFTPGKGFYVTKEGLEAWDDFHHHNIARRDPTQPLTAYFDADAYGLKRAKKKPFRNVREMRRAGAA